MIIGIDFDGTCVSHKYPEIGEDIGAQPVLSRLVKSGHLFNLNTMRSGKELSDAIDWFGNNHIPLNGINEDPGQRNWTSSPKVYAEMYIDDISLGCPLIYPTGGERPYVDWGTVEQYLEAMGLFNDR